jgi:prevent-host-death family protein
MRRWVIVQDDCPLPVLMMIVDRANFTIYTDYSHQAWSGVRVKEETIAAGQFKAKCLQILDEVERTRIPRTVTKRGRPVARLVPMAEAASGSLFGCLKGMLQITGDIVDGTEEKWDADA